MRGSDRATTIPDQSHCVTVATATQLLTGIWAAAPLAVVVHGWK